MNKYYKIEKQEDGKQIITIEAIPMLYRYLSINNYTVTALMKNELWGTVPIIFNDPYDMIFCYSRAHIKRVIMEKLTNYRANQYPVLFQTTSKARIVDKIADALLLEFNNMFRQAYCIACFSEVNDSEIMWGHYADCAKGFVVAYDGYELRNVATQKNKSVFEEEEELETIAPVIYSNGKMNFDKIVIDILDPVMEHYDDLLFCKTYGDVIEASKALFDKIHKISIGQQTFRNDAFYSALSNKNKVWSYEKEWRVWSYNTNLLRGQNDPYVKIGNVKPKAIYLGERISEYDEMVLLSIAKEKLNIPVYKMETKILKNSCKLVSKKI